MLDQAGDRMTEILPRFKRWAEANPKNAMAQFAYAKAILASGDRQTGEKLLRQSIALNGDQWESHYELGVLLERQRKFAEAAAELERAIAINAGAADAHYQLSGVYDRLGKSDKAAAERRIHERLTQANGVK
jgi:tetratricopeptide (TPR) repeat protein